MILNRRIPVIYILSNGRSGSTLLDMLLGLYPEVWTLGEAQILPWELRENRAPCGCGTELSECNFWSSILPELPINEGSFPIEFFREKHNAGKVLRPKLLPDIRAYSISARWQEAVQEYGVINWRYFSTVKIAAEERSGHQIKYLVDASKDPYRLFWMLKSGRFDLYVIHLLKDPRAFVYSMVKRDPGSFRTNLRFSVRWKVENSLFAHLCADPELNGKTMLLRYEQIASDPNGVLERLGDWLQVEARELTPESFRDKENHAISGNPMRWLDTEIALDQKWLRNLPHGYARLIWFAARRQAKSYGY